MTLGDVIRSFASPATDPIALAWTGKFLLYSNSGDPAKLIDPFTGRVIRDIQIANNTGTGGLVYVSGRIWHASHGTDTIELLDSDGRFIRDFPSPAGIPTGITFDGKYLWITDQGTNRAYQMDTDGHIIRSFGTRFQPRNIVFDGRDLWIVSISGPVQKYDLNGAEITTFTPPGTQVGNRGLTFDGKYLWYCNNVDDLIYQISIV